MALLMTYQLQGDYPVNAYVKIAGVKIYPDQAAASQIMQGGKFMMTCHLEVKSGANKNVLDNWNGEWKHVYDHTSNVNAIRQMYNYLKTLPEFASATDDNS